MVKQRLLTGRVLKSSRQINAIDFAYHRSELRLYKSISQSSTRIQIMSYHQTEPCGNIPCPSNFHYTLLAPGTFHFDCTPCSKVNVFTILNHLICSTFQKNHCYFRLIAILSSYEVLRSLMKYKRKTPL